MNILAIDTTTKVASVAILNNDKITQNLVSNEITHSEKLLPLIDETLKETNLTLKDIDMYAVINGPGSFTGIRIGLSTLKAFAMIDNLKTFSLSSTLLIAYTAYMNNIDKVNKNESINVLSLIDARNDRVYYSLNTIYIDDNKKVVIDTVIETSNDLIDNALTSVKNKIDNFNVIIAGNCVEKFKEKFTNNFENAILNDMYPTPSDLISAYQNILNADKYMYDTYTLDAIYARASQAERVKNNEN